jgi:uncharacterized protein YeaO (DUF488 family)
MIKTAYASDFNKKKTRPPNSGTAVLITRGGSYPWLDYDEWIIDLSPLRNTLSKWKKSKQTEEDWKKYREKFLPQMKKSKAVNKIEQLRQRSKNGESITLLCYCKPGLHCHRYIIKSLINGSNTVIESD